MNHALRRDADAIVSEIAAELGCGAGSVRMLMVRARQKARLLLSEPAGKEG